MKKPKVLAYPSRNVAEFLRELSRNFNFAEKTLSEISDFYFPARKKKYFAQGVFRGETRKMSFFSWADLYIQPYLLRLIIRTVLKTKKVIHLAYFWVLSSEPYRRCSLGNLCVCVFKTTVFGNEELLPFLETPKLILTFIQTIDIGLKQRLMQSGNKMYIVIK